MISAACDIGSEILMKEVFAPMFGIWFSNLFSLFFCYLKKKKWLINKLIEQDKEVFTDI